jgi:hypothetical protein
MLISRKRMKKDENSKKYTLEKSVLVGKDENVPQE